MIEHKDIFANMKYKTNLPYLLYLSLILSLMHLLYLIAIIVTTTQKNDAKKVW